MLKANYLISSPGLYMNIEFVDFLSTRSIYNKY